MHSMRPAIWCLVLFLTWGLVSCASPPRGVTPVDTFDPGRYLGKWYEIARLDHGFEKNLTHVTATYVETPDGGIEVLNRGYHSEKEQWEEIRGRARSMGDPGQGSLEVSFFPPFAGGYHVIALDRNAYQWAVVSGPTRNFLWILSRTPTMDEGLRERLIGIARQNGFATDELVLVPQDDPPPVEEAPAE